MTRGPMLIRGTLRDLNRVQGDRRRSRRTIAEILEAYKT
ncbi:MAG: hypothetical protein AVDCRST_MAG12-3429 [uncultured Rubrobacteraceae bacterium]|uniref:Uncharacterized protein n=1 Tax=uncultured Rubrobacteraceae bacterium TaxID=349277 RepID=A0A6J4T6N2_9ACTN|nr:MAG: hypothetical protein AVDCRST_MAG12-3429 [uncultured Rubrobacteraceae bacterium]